MKARYLFLAVALLARVAYVSFGGVGASNPVNPPSLVWTAQTSFQTTTEDSNTVVASGFTPAQINGTWTKSGDDYVKNSGTISVHDGVWFLNDTDSTNTVAFTNATITGGTWVLYDATGAWTDGVAGATAYLPVTNQNTVTYRTRIIQNGAALSVVKSVQTNADTAVTSTNAITITE